MAIPYLITEGKAFLKVRKDLHQTVLLKLAREEGLLEGPLHVPKAHFFSAIALGVRCNLHPFHVSHILGTRTSQAMFGPGGTYLCPGLPNKYDLGLSQQLVFLPALMGVKAHTPSPYIRQLAWPCPPRHEWKETIRVRPSKALATRSMTSVFSDGKGKTFSPFIPDVPSYASCDSRIRIPPQFNKEGKLINKDEVVSSLALLAFRDPFSPAQVPDVIASSSSGKVSSPASKKSRSEGQSTSSILPVCDVQIPSQEDMVMSTPPPSPRQRTSFIEENAPLLSPQVSEILDRSITLIPMAPEFPAPPRPPSVVSAGSEATPPLYPTPFPVKGESVPPLLMAIDTTRRASPLEVNPLIAAVSPLFSPPPFSPNVFSPARVKRVPAVYIVDDLHDRSTRFFFVCLGSL